MRRSSILAFMADSSSVITLRHFSGARNTPKSGVQSLSHCGHQLVPASTMSHSAQISDARSTQIQNRVTLCAYLAS